MSKQNRIAIRLDNRMYDFIKLEAKSIGISSGLYIRLLVREKMNEADRIRTQHNER